MVQYVRLSAQVRHNKGSNKKYERFVVMWNTIVYSYYYYVCSVQYRRSMPAVFQKTSSRVNSGITTYVQFWMERFEVKKKLLFVDVAIIIFENSNMYYSYVLIERVPCGHHSKRMHEFHTSSLSPKKEKSDCTSIILSYVLSSICCSPRSPLQRTISTLNKNLISFAISEKLRRMQLSGILWRFFYTRE